MRNLKIQLALLLMVCALCAVVARRQPSYQLDLKSYGCLENGREQTLLFRQHRFRLFTWNGGSTKTVARGRYWQYGRRVILDDECSRQRIEYQMSDNESVLTPPPNLSVGSCRLMQLECGGPISDTPHSEELTESPMSICGIRCGMTMDEVEARLGKPKWQNESFQGYESGCQVHFNAKNFVIGVSGDEVWQDAHLLSTPRMTELNELFGLRLIFYRPGKVAIDEEYGVTFELFERVKDDWVVQGATMGDMQEPGLEGSGSAPNGDTP